MAGMVVGLRTNTNFCGRFSGLVKPSPWLKALLLDIFEVLIHVHPNRHWSSRCMTINLSCLWRHCEGPKWRHLCHLVLKWSHAGSSLTLQILCQSQTWSNNLTPSRNITRLSGERTEWMVCLNTADARYSQVDVYLLVFWFRLNAER